MKSRNLNTPDKEQSKKTDMEVALAWLHTPPKLPPSENPLDIAYPQVIWLGSSLTELVTKWNVSAADAEQVFESWAIARRRLRTLSLTDERESPTKLEMQAAIEKDFRTEQQAEHQPISARLRDLAGLARQLEQSGYEVSLKWAIKMLCEPIKITPRNFLNWLTGYWITTPNNDLPPLCLCSDSLLGEIFDRNRYLIDQAAISKGDSLRRTIYDLGLRRPKKPRLNLNWLNRKSREFIKR